ncbi:MAG: zinc ribbon domain-containing protein [Nitrososphaerota archaeon]|nr:zinc ribbon domain-containing protein [Candidatus Calditenuis fumarioli]
MGPGAPGVSGSGADLRQRLLRKYAEKGLLVMTVVDVNVDDVIVALFEVRLLLHLMRRSRTWRNTGKLLFVRRVNRMSMRVYGRPATSWLRYAKNLDNDWVNKSVALVKRFMARSSVVVIEDLDPQRLREKLRSKDPEKAYLFSTWPVAKILRRIRAVAERAGKLLVVPPNYTSSICIKCLTLMEHDEGKWSRLRCPKCGFREDRDHVAVWNLAKSALVVLGFHYLDTYLGRSIKAYKEAVDALTPALTRALSQGPEPGPGVSEEGGEASSPEPSLSSRPARGDLGEGANEPSSDDDLGSQRGPVQ